VVAALKQYEHFGLPQNAPDLPEDVDVLWVVDQVTASGWLWEPTRERWSSLTRPS